MNLKEMQDDIYLIAEDIASVFDCHNVCVFIEYPEGDRAVVFT